MTGARKSMYAQRAELIDAASTWRSSSRCGCFPRGRPAGSGWSGTDGEARRREELPRRGAGERVVPRELVEDVERACLLELEPETRLAGPLLDHEEPARIVGRLLAAAALHLRDRQVEAEEVDVGIGLGLVEGTAHLVARRLLLLGRRQQDELARLAQVDRPVGVPRPIRAVRVDDGGRVLLQQLAADREHGLRRLGARAGAVVVVAEIRLGQPGVQLGDIVELLPERVLAQPLRC